MQHRGIEITLDSQYDGLPLPEYSPHSLANCSPTEEATHYKENEAVAKCLVPTYFGARFWISFTVSQAAEYFAFTLFIDGKLIADWVVPARKMAHGRVMHSLFSTAKEFEYEKRAFVFPTISEGEDFEPYGAEGELGEIRVVVYRGARDGLPPSLPHIT